MANQYELNVGVTPEPKSVEDLLQSNTPPASPLPALLIEDAYFFVEKGCNVIPVIGKKTTVQWAHLQKRRQTLDEINTYNWKLATGLSMILGINDIHSFDIDDVRDHTVLIDLLTKLGLPPDYEWVEKTGNGYQIFFACSHQYDITVISAEAVDGRFDHLELRWKNCYSVVPPSQHFDKISNAFDGKLYSWLNDPPRQRPATIPINIVLDAWKAFTKDDSKVVTRGDSGKPQVRDHSIPEIDEAIQKFDMRKFLHAQRIAFSEENDAQHQVRIQYEKGHNSLLWSDEKHCSNWMREGKGSGLIDTIALIVYGKYNLNELEPRDKVNVFEILSHFSGVKLEDPKPKIRKRHNTGELIWTDGNELFNEPDEIVECIVKGVLETESFNSIYGEPGAGKSMATLELCLKVVSEKNFQWLGKDIQKRGDVLYIRYEGGRRKFKERFKKMCRALNLSREEMKRFHSIENPPTLSVLEEEIRSKCELWKPVLIAVDSLYMSHEKEENSNTDMRELGKLLQEFMNTYGLCVLVIHHTNKHIGDKPLHLDNFRGASMGALCESLMELRRDGQDETKRIWKWTKLRNGEDEDMRCEGGYFEPATFFTQWTGGVDENEHLRGTMKKRKDFADYFEGAPGLQRSVLVERIMKADNLKSDSSSYTRIDKALERGILKLNTDTKLIELGGK